MWRTSSTLWVLLGLMWLINLPLRPLLDPDEGRYAEIPREMAASNDWVTPTLNGYKYFEKPPLQYWATAAIYSVFGVHDWTSRLWAAALAFSCIPLVFYFARGVGYSAETSLVAAALLATNPYYEIAGQLNLLDQGFTFFSSVAVFSFVLAQREHLRPERSRRWMLSTWSALALAVLSKGIVVLVLAGATLAAYLLTTRSATLLRRLHLGVGIPVFLAITVPWFWVVQARNPDFFQFFFIREHFERFLTRIHERVEPFWYFVPMVLIALLPIIANFRRWHSPASKAAWSSGAFHTELFLLLWCAVVFAFFSLSQSKLASYVLPIMPALAIALARVTEADRRAFPRAQWICVGLLLAMGAGLMAVATGRLGGVPTSSLVGFGAIGLLCVAYLGMERIWMRDSADVARQWIGLAVFSILGYQLIAPCFLAAYPVRSACALAASVSHEITPDTPIYSVGQYRHSMAFYLRRPLDVYDYAGELEFGMKQAGIDPLLRDRQAFLEQWRRRDRAIAIIDSDSYPELVAAGIPGRIIARDSRTIVLARS